MAGRATRRPPRKRCRHGTKRGSLLLVVRPVVTAGSLARISSPQLWRSPRLFLSNGYGPTSIRAVAEEAGLAVQTVYAVFGNAAAVDPEFAELNQAMIARRRAEMADGATLLAGDDGLRVSPDDAAASLFVLCSPHVAQLLTEHLGWSFDRCQAWLADAIERLILNDQIADEGSNTSRISTSTAQAEPAP